MEKRETASQIEQIRLKNQAIELAVQYSFVTEVTSLVVVRPDKEWRPYIDDAYENGNYKTLCLCCYEMFIMIIFLYIFCSIKPIDTFSETTPQGADHGGARKENVVS